MGDWVGSGSGLDIFERETFSFSFWDSNLRTSRVYDGLYTDYTIVPISLLQRNTEG